MSARLLMCSPEYFGVQYVINPWMQGQVGQTDARKAARQWEDFSRALGQCADISLIPPRPSLPDLVFTANAGVAYKNKFVPSHFRHAERQGEEPLFKDWFKEQGYEEVALPPGVYCEGAGDALFQPGRELLWGGYGFRTDFAAHAFLADVFKVEVAPLHLVNPRFYHLDTCFCPLLDDRVMYYPGAFDATSRRLIEERVPAQNRVAVPEEDAAMFACNAVLVDDLLFMNHASPGLRWQLEKAGYQVIVQPVHEFLKSGGANKCLTMALDGYEITRSFAFRDAA